jgi:death-on-curing protein
LKRDQIAFFTVDQIRRLHTDVIANYGGGLDGTRDEGQLESAVIAPQNAYVFTLAGLAAVYVHGLAKGHAFLDGNKRIGITTGIAFLEANGFVVTPPAAEWEQVMVDVATDVISRDDLAELLAEAMGGDVELED